MLQIVYETSSNQKMLILASASPRRSELLAQAGIAFIVHPAEICEDQHPGEDPSAYVLRLAREKAEAVYRERTQTAPGLPPDDGIEDSLVVLGADTTVTIDGEILSKPTSPADAARMLARLSGRTHLVLTGVALVTARSTQVAVESTTVQFIELSPQEIEEYVATGEPLDKAGAYAIQGRAARWIPRIEGCYFNVVGLPLARLATLLDGCESTTARTQY